MTKPPRDEKKSWDKFLDGLNTHADGHIDIHLETVAAIRSAILSVSSAQNCGELKAEMGAAASAAEAKFSKAHAKYDRETQDGRKQGAILKKQLE